MFFLRLELEIKYMKNVRTYVDQCNGLDAIKFSFLFAIKFLGQVFSRIAFVIFRVCVCRCIEENKSKTLTANQFFSIKIAR